MSPIDKPSVASGYRTAKAQSSNELRVGYPGRRPMRIPTLQTDDLDPKDYARSTCFAAGYLTVKNAGWLRCYMYCPDGAVFKVSNDPALCPSNRTDTSVEIDLDFCKGCGICARACASGAIRMIPEGQARQAEEAHEKEAE